MSQLQALQQLVLSHNWLQALRGPGGEGGFAALCELRGLASLALANVSDKRHALQVGRGGGLRMGTWRQLADMPAHGHRFPAHHAHHP
jgi:hypothetical protein